MDSLDKYKGDFPALAGSSDVSDFIKDNHLTVSEEVARLASSNENQSLLSRLFPSELEKVFSDAKVRAATTELEFRHAALELSAKSKMEAVEEQCQSMVQMVKAHHRSQFAKFVTSAYEDLQGDIDAKIEKHLEASRKRYEMYEKFKDLPTGKHYLKHLLSSEERFFEWINGLLENFRTIAEEKVRQYKL